MYKYSKMVMDNKLDFLNKYKYNTKYCNDYKEKSLNDLVFLVDNYIVKNRNGIFGTIDYDLDVSKDRLTFVKSYLVEFDIFCSLYEEGKIGYDVLRNVIGNRLNYLLYLYNITRYEGLDYLDDDDRKRIDVAFNYLFSNLVAINIINHDMNKKFRSYIFSGSNNYEEILSSINIDEDMINYEKEFNDFLDNYNLNNVLKMKKNIGKILKRY